MSSVKQIPAQSVPSQNLPRLFEDPGVKGQPPRWTGLPGTMLRLRARRVMSGFLSPSVRGLTLLLAINGSVRVTQHDNRVIRVLLRGLEREEDVLESRMSARRIFLAVEEIGY